MATRQRYRVYYAQGMSDVEGSNYIGVEGPRVSYHAKMQELTKLADDAINGRAIFFTPKERSVLRQMLAAAMAGEHEFSLDELKALNAVLLKLNRAAY